ncbi:MAG: HD domain-containing protein [Cyanobacteria bacterium]|nr:HD domain-containing protein [Cyanobacteriota bacterium]
MLIAVSFDELLGSSRLGFDLYGCDGEVIYRSGYRLNDAELTEMKGLRLYRDQANLPKDFTGTPTEYFEHEGVFMTMPVDSADDEKKRLVREAFEQEQPGILDPALSDSFLKSMRYFLDGIRRGAAPDVALCELLADKLVCEVTTKADQLQYLSQMRVRDQFTYSHTMEVSALAVALAMKAGFGKKEIREIGLASIIHDLGKLLIPKRIMFKPGRLSEKEFEVMKLHPGLGYRIIRDSLKLSDDIARPALEHQEMFGGGGYPNNLSGNEIHPYSHIVKIADVYDALTSKRPYKEAIASQKAIKIMLSEGARSFHPELLAMFIEMANYHDESRFELVS